MTSNRLDKVIYSYATNTSAMEEENHLLKEMVTRLDGELKRLKEPALMICEVVSALKDNQAIIKIPNGNRFLANVLTDVDLEAGDHVLTEQKNLNVVGKVPITKKFNVEKFVILEKPTIGWDVVGSLEREKEELREVIELPLKKPELFRKVGISPPKGVLLYGPPGTGKTLMAKAVASSTNATFIEVVGSELVQKFIGEGAKLVSEIFEMARKKGPTIIFIDELDALAARRVEIGTSGEREVNRTFMQLLAELDGFKPLGNVKVIGATNRKDIIDPAMLRPGRLDRLIRVDVPDAKGRAEILKIHTKNMRLEKKINLSELAGHMDDFSGAEIRAVCTEAGYFAIRKNRYMIKNEDFMNAIEKVKRSEEEEGKDYLNMFG